MGVEQKRAELSAQNKSLTPITLQTFVAWKKRKLREKKAREQKENEDKKKKMKQGFTVGMSGRDMFMFDPKMVSNEDNDENPEEDQVKVHEIKFDEFGIMDDGLEESTADQLKNLGEGDDEAEGATAID